MLTFQGWATLDGLLTKPTSLQKRAMNTKYGSRLEILVPSNHVRDKTIPWFVKLKLVPILI